MNACKLLYEGNEHANAFPRSVPALKNPIHAVAVEIFHHRRLQRALSSTYFKDSRNSESMMGDNNVANNNVALFRGRRIENVNFNRNELTRPKNTSRVYSFLI